MRDERALARIAAPETAPVEIEASEFSDDNSDHGENYPDHQID
jgi:hypothetical protein